MTQLTNLPLVEIKGLRKQYGSKVALEDINLTLQSGRIIGLLGPNGSGKTTLIKLMSGLLTPSTGEILISGMKIGIETKRRVSYLPERTYLRESMRVEDAVAYFNDFYDNFDAVRARDMMDRLKINPRSHLRNLSKGTREKVQLILVMSRNADLYLLDEPIGGVDPAARDYILDTIIRNYSPSASILISTHLIADVEQVLDEVIFIADGRIGLQASAADIRESHGLSIDAYFREVFRC